MSGRVVVFGSINMDLVAGVERISRPGETVPGLSFATFPGGKGGNQALAAHLAGGAVHLLGKVGDDPLGHELLDFYRARGLPVDGIALSAAQPTGTALIQVERASGENSIVVVPGANGDFAPGEMDGVEVAAGDVVLSLFEVPLDCIARLFERARGAGATTVLNPAPAKPADPALLGAVDVLVVNETELAFFSGAEVSEASGEDAIAAAARSLAVSGDQTVVVTLGVRGTLAVRGAETIRVPGRRVQAVDTTGAGDCFVGTLAASSANAAASLSVQREGAGPSMPSADEIEALLRGQEG
jgi:ribokinase